MKKIVGFFMFSLLSVILMAQEQTTSPRPHGLFWQAGVAFGATFTEDKPTMVAEPFATLGYRFSHHLMLGGGLSTYNTETLNLYALARINLLRPSETRTHYPYVAFRGGYAWSTWTGETWGDDKGPMFDLHLGWSFYTPEGKLRWSVYLSPGLYQYEFVPKAGLCFEFGK
jgi:hypothetical protein